MDYHAPFGSVADAFGYALPTSLLGFLTVFGVLALLWGILEIMKLFFYTLPNRRAKPQTAPTVEKEVIEEAPQTDDAAIVAAITAAITAYRASIGQSAGGFRVVSFAKRK